MIFMPDSCSCRDPYLCVCVELGKTRLLYENTFSVFGSYRNLVFFCRIAFPRTFARIAVCYPGNFLVCGSTTAAGTPYKDVWCPLLSCEVLLLDSWAGKNVSSSEYVATAIRVYRLTARRLVERRSEESLRRCPGECLIAQRDSRSMDETRYRRW